MFLVVWELASRGGVINTVFYSKPTDIVVRLWQDVLGAQVYGRTIYEQIWITTQSVLIGYVTGSVGGTLVGFAVGRSKWLSRALEPYIFTFYAIPKISIAPLFILILGIGLESKVAIVAMESFFILFTSTLRGVVEIDEELVQVARIMGASRRTVFGRILVPASLPAIFAGLQLAVPFAGIGAWELGARFSALNLNDAGIQGGREENVTVGLNWYPDPGIRFMWNWIKVTHLSAPFDRPYLNGASPNIFLMRAQVNW
ncbi:MAG: porin [bacterium]